MSEATPIQSLEESANLLRERRIAGAQMILDAALQTGYSEAVFLVLQHYAERLPPLDWSLEIELQALMAEYSTLLAHLDIIQAAREPANVGLRLLIRQHMMRQKGA